MLFVIDLLINWIRFIALISPLSSRVQEKITNGLTDILLKNDKFHSLTIFFFFQLIITLLYFLLPHPIPLYKVSLNREAFPHTYEATATCYKWSESQNGNNQPVSQCFFLTAWAWHERGTFKVREIRKIWVNPPENGTKIWCDSECVHKKVIYLYVGFCHVACSRRRQVMLMCTIPFSFDIEEPTLIPVPRVKSNLPIGLKHWLELLCSLQNSGSCYCLLWLSEVCRGQICAWSETYSLCAQLQMEACKCWLDRK